MFSPEFMRPEVWHALSVHFPIALLPVATITFLISFFVKASGKKGWRTAATLLLFAGTLMAWVSTFTGDSAEAIVARKICDPTILKDHEIASETMTWIFTVAAALCLTFTSNLARPGVRMISIYLTFLLMLVGTGYLVYTGHIGATLVYDQGAGVKNHVVNCE